VRAVHYLVERKNRHHGDAIAGGWNAATVAADGRRLEPDALHLIGGLQHGSLELLQAARAARAPYVFFDRAYFGGGPGSEWLRVVPGAYQKHWVDRWPARFPVALEPWRTAGGHILLVPPANDAIKALFGLKDWQDQTLARLRACTDRPVMVSVKPDPRPLAERLRDCWCVVTWTSNVAVEAICAGVPAIVGPESAAAPVAGRLDDLENAINQPPRPEREQWAASLTWGQFTLDEIRNGEARDSIA
jgi:hypothetical protein